MTGTGEVAAHDDYRRCMTLVLAAGSPHHHYRCPLCGRAVLGQMGNARRHWLMHTEAERQQYAEAEQEQGKEASGATNVQL